MEQFEIQLNCLRSCLNSMNLSDKEAAAGRLVSLAEGVQEDILRERVQVEADKTVADRAGRMILERLNDDWRLREESSDLPWLEDHHKRSSAAAVPVHESFRLPAAISGADVMMYPDEDLANGQSMELIWSDSDPQPEEDPLDSSDSYLQLSVEDGDDVPYRCVTCSYKTSDRKALYRHGVRENHQTRSAMHYTGSLKCGFCLFATNKKFNLDRHLQRVHFPERNHVCYECGSAFKDSNTLKVHIRNRHQRRPGDLSRVHSTTTHGRAEPAAPLISNSSSLPCMDLRDPAKGTWMGVARDGRVGMMLSITQPIKTRRSDAPSRGAIPSTYLRSSQSAPEYCESIIDVAGDYNGYQFVALDRDDQNNYRLFTLTNRFVDSVETKEWSNGTAGAHVISNSPPHVPYKKVVYGKEKLETLVSGLSDETSEDDIVKALLELAEDKTNHFPDPQLALQTQNVDDFNRPMCSIFIRFPQDMFRYGTRSHSILIVDKEDNATFYEKRILEAPENVDDATWAEKTVRFKISDEGNKI